MTVVLTAGLGFGDEGKGATIDYLARTTTVGDSFSTLVVRYNGGAQCGHNVLTTGHAHHTFSQFGSATLAGGQTHLSRHMLVNPVSLSNEAKGLEDEFGINAYEGLTIEGDALVTNFFQMFANQAREAKRGENKHGSCGMGIGETVGDFLQDPESAIRVSDMQDRNRLRRKLTLSRDRKMDEFGAAPYGIDTVKPFSDDRVDYYVDLYVGLAKQLKIVDHTFLEQQLRKRRTIIFEGAQGVLLDQDHGFHPYTTWSDTTFGNALDLLNGYDGPVRRIGVVRGYMTRHGAGPLPSEVDEPFIRRDLHNKWHIYQGNFRLGWFDLLLTRYALKVIGGVDEIALTNLDNLPERPKLVFGYKLADGVQMVELPVQPYDRELAASRRGDPERLAQQQQLGETLMTAAPVGIILESQADLIRTIQQELGCYISLCADGPTSADRTPTRVYLSQLEPKVRRAWRRQAWS
jgi:adenylosuccinate synthase